ncbi:MAG: tRNA uridine-5-carboxymethylaminomethyl(34) synthesis GTPase MnmE [Bacteriovoracia bacterium]
MSPAPVKPRDQSGYLSEDTIAALSSAIGGAIAIVRMSGRESRRILGELLVSPGGSGAMADGFHFGEAAKLQRVAIPGIDDAMVAWFENPRSYTGEDLAEFHLHGSAFIAGKLLARLFELGARQALPGEFSFRAVKNGKMSFVQAQGVADLISAANDPALGLALEKSGGGQNAFYEELGKELRELAALSELGIDFSDQDVDEVALPRLKAKVKGLTEKLVRLRETYRRGNWIQEGIGVALVGRPNAGKSSFFNALLGEDRSIVAETAGTTRDLVREKITLRSGGRSASFRLVDTAGLRRSEDRVESEGIRRTVQAAKQADLNVVLVDGTCDVTEELTQVSDLVSLDATQCVGILTKADLLSTEDRDRRLEIARRSPISQWFFTSAVTQEGIAEAASGLVDFCASWITRKAGEVILTRLDHLQATQATLDILINALEAREVELFAADLRHGLAAFSPVIGQTLPDDILGQIFSEFCIGK